LVFASPPITPRPAAVFSVFNFHFTYALTFIHTLVTMAGMQGFLHAGLFEPKTVPRMQAHLIFPI
jgi:hypothetical protein